MASIQIRNRISSSDVEQSGIHELITFPLDVTTHLILRAFTAGEWQWAKEQLELLAPNTMVVNPTVWRYQLCAECKRITPNNSYCPIVFCCVNCASSLGIHGHSNRWNWTQSIMFRFTKFPTNISNEIHKALEQMYDQTL